MSDKQISIVLDSKVRERIRAEAILRESTISMVARSLIIDGLNRLSQPEQVLSRLVLEEMLIALFGIEALIVNVFLNPETTLKEDKEIKNQLLETLDSNARKKVRKLLSGDGK